MFTFLLIVQTVIAASLVLTILMQRSEGGGLGVGGSSSGFMTARGAADFLTRVTSILGALFIILSIMLAGYAGVNRKPVEIDTSLVNQSAPVVPNVVPAPTDQAAPATGQQSGNQAAPAVPLAQ
ncbi:MAG: preprotein translocase subunit SecG [Sphingomonas bacterium]|nr:preprotein translocase subunit SecG [Sphingomonas bacterium]